MTKKIATLLLICCLGLPSCSSGPSQPDLQALPDSLDILLVVDNSGSMVGEQIQLGTNLNHLITALGHRFQSDEVHVAVSTTGVKSEGCGSCSTNTPYSCVNETGESGVFQDRYGQFVSIEQDIVEYSSVNRPECKILQSIEADLCLFNNESQAGTILVGVNGCGYERGLSAIRLGLSPKLTNSTNQGFLRPEAQLVVIVVSDEDDCGEVGDITEGIAGVGGRVCYYAAKGLGPVGATSSPDDPDDKPYALTPVSDYLEQLIALKDGRPGMVKFAAVVGITDPNDPLATSIEYTDDSDPSSDIVPACTTPTCTGRYCAAYPGTRYIGLADLLGLGLDGYVASICQADFSTTLRNMGHWLACPRIFHLTGLMSSPESVEVMLDGAILPRFSCNLPGSFAELQACNGLDDQSTCAAGSRCVPTWTYKIQTSNPEFPNGSLVFGAHADLCELSDETGLRISLVYPD